MGEWINIKDMYPESSGKYLVCCLECGKWQRVTLANFYSGGFERFTGRRSYWKITHWMPIPDPPEIDIHT